MCVLTRSAAAAPPHIQPPHHMFLSCVCPLIILSTYVGCTAAWHVCGCTAAWHVCMSGIFQCHHMTRRHFTCLHTRFWFVVVTAIVASVDWHSMLKLCASPSVCCLCVHPLIEHCPCFCFCFTQLTADNNQQSPRKPSTNTYIANTCMGCMQCVFIDWFVRF